MRGKLAELNAADAFRLKADSAPVEALGIGIGINSGEALVGNMGLETRFDYSALGDTVNVASRVESACKEVGYDLLVTESVRAAAPDFATLEAGALTLKGKSDRVVIYLLVGDEAVATTGAFKLLRNAHGEALAALRTGADPTGAIAECKALAQKLEPGLRSFYDRLADRGADFAAAPPDQRAAE